MLDFALPPRKKKKKTDFNANWVLGSKISKKSTTSKNHITRPLSLLLGELIAGLLISGLYNTDFSYRISGEFSCTY